MIKTNVNLQDTIFSYRYGNPKNLYVLHKLLFDEDQDIVLKDIQNITIDNELADGILNGVKYSCRDKIVIVLESRVLENPNLVAHFLISYASMLEDYFESLDEVELDQKRIHLPEPYFFLVYTGSKEGQSGISKTQNVKLDNKNLNMDLKVRVIDSLDKDSFFSEYIQLSKSFNNQLDSRDSVIQAIRDAVKHCMNLNKIRSVLQEIAEKEPGALEKIFEQEVLARGHGYIDLEEDLIDGFLHGWLKGEQRAREQFLKLINLQKKGLSKEEIAKRMKLPQFEVEEMIRQLDDAAEIHELELEEIESAIKSDQ